MCELYLACLKSFTTPINAAYASLASSKSRCVKICRSRTKLSYDSVTNAARPWAHNALPVDKGGYIGGEDVLGVAIRLGLEM